MKIDLSTQLKDVWGKPIVDETGAPIALCHVLVNAAHAHYEGDQFSDGAAKAKLAILAKKLAVDGEVDLPIEDIALIKERVGRGMPTAVIGAVNDILDPPED